MLDQGTTDLTENIYAFNAKIIGAGNVYIENPSFELPGYTTSDFNLIPGWKVLAWLKIGLQKLKYTREVHLCCLWIRFLKENLLPRSDLIPRGYISSCLR